MKPTLTAATLVRNSGKSFQIQIRLFFAAFICILLLGSIIIDPNTPLITTFCFQAGDNLDNGVIYHISYMHLSKCIEQSFDGIDSRIYALFCSIVLHQHKPSHKSSGQKSNGQCQFEELHFSSDLGFLPNNVRCCASH